jgi:hypothetical protein
MHVRSHGSAAPGDAVGRIVVKPLVQPTAACGAIECINVKVALRAHARAAHFGGHKLLKSRTVYDRHRKPGASVRQEDQGGQLACPRFAHQVGDAAGSPLERDPCSCQ